MNRRERSLDGPNRRRELSDDLLPFSKARHLVPRSANGKTKSPSTLWRWAKKGFNGKKLKYEQVGRVAYTTERWLHEFWWELASTPTELEAPYQGCDDSSDTNPIDKDLARKAEQELRDLGMNP